MFASPRSPNNRLCVSERTDPRRALEKKAGRGWSIGRREMAIGPVQLIVLGFSHPEFHGEIIAELERLRESDTVRVIDALAVHKDADGEIEVQHLSNLSKDEAIELGSKVGALIGLGIEGEEGAIAGAEAGAERQPKAFTCSPTRRPGMSWRRSRTTRPRR